MAVVVEESLAVVDAVLPCRDHRARLALGAIQHRLDRGVRRLPAELAGERQHAPLPDMRRADHRREVAAEIVRMAHVGRQHLQHVAPHHAAVVEPQRRDADALLPDLGGAGVVGAVRGAADVALVRAVDRPEHRPVALEHRHEGGQIGKVVAAVIRIVQQEYIARMDVVPEEFGDRLRGPWQGADMDRHVLGLRDQAAVQVADRGGEIAAGIKDLGIRGPQHRLAHLFDDGVQSVLHDRDGYRIDGVGQALPPRIAAITIAKE